jgi:hypothetical protein
MGYPPEKVRTSVGCALEDLEYAGTHVEDMEARRDLDKIVDDLEDWRNSWALS